MNTTASRYRNVSARARRAAAAAAAGLLAGLGLASAPAARNVPPCSMVSSMYGDHRARNIGDVLTVIIVEESAASLDAQQKTDKSMTLDGSASFYHPRLDANPIAWTNYTIPAFNAQAARTYAGKGSLENKGSLSGSIACRVTEVLPNGNLLIEGRRAVVVRNETVQFILTGTIRYEDIDRDNTVKSTQVADASISYLTSGSIADTQKKGIVPSLLDWINPF